jgi:transposase
VKRAYCANRQQASKLNLPAPQAVLKNAKRVNPEAYEAYLKGRYFWNKRTADGLKKAADYFNQAVEKDPNYAQAYAGLADSYALLGDWEYGVLLHPRIIKGTFLWHTGLRGPMVPRLLRLHPSTYQRLTRLSKEADRDGAYRVAKRLRAVVMNSDGHTSGQLAEILQAPRSKVSEWLQRYQTDGIDGLLEGVRSGRPAELTGKQQQQLGDILDSGPVAYGLDSGIWTSPMIAWVIEEEFGVQYHPGHVRKLLHSWGFSVQRPRRVLARADAAAQDRWHRRIYPSLKKKRNRGTGH